MEIKIEFSNSYEAVMTIDGRRLEYGLQDNVFRFKGNDVSYEDLEKTIGGLVALKLTSPLIDILQGWMPDEPSPDEDVWGTWETLTETAAQEVAEAMDH